ncbi:MAG: hypothetical protein WA863_05315, partial [Methyloceanibacter sp.]
EWGMGERSNGESTASRPESPANMKERQSEADNPHQFENQSVAVGLLGRGSRRWSFHIGARE